MKKKLWKCICVVTFIDEGWTDRWSFLKDNWDSNEVEEGQRYEIARVLSAPGEKHGWKVHQYYDSSVMMGDSNTL